MTFARDLANLGDISNNINFSNALINGSFSVSQRATSFASGANNDDAYTLDRWYILSDGNDAIDVTQETSTVPTNGQFAIALDVETANKKFGIAQIVENKNCLGLIGNTVTFSFKAKVSATTKLDNVKAAIVSWSGTADSVTSDIISAWGAEGTNPTLIANATFENTPANLNVTTSYATYSVTAAVDTASTKNIIVFIWSDVTDTTAGDFLYISQAKLEVGPAATPFNYANNFFQNELALCQRYLPGFVYAAANTALPITGRHNSTSASKCWAVFPTTTRVAPTGITISSAGHFIAYDHAGDNRSCTGVTFDYAGLNAATLNLANTSANFISGNSFVLGTNNSAAYILFTGCEL
jgi:hypothetical protein